MQKNSMKILIYLICLLSLSGLLQSQNTPPLTVALRQQQTEPLLVIEVQIKMTPQVHIYTSPGRFFAIEESASSGLGKMQLELPAPEKCQDIDGTIVDTYFWHQNPAHQTRLRR